MRSRQKIKNKPTNLFLLFQFLSIYLFSQNFAIKNFSENEGFTTNRTYAILRDRDGFMWFGTQNGLYRYDGTSFKLFQHQSDNPASLAGNLIMDIKEDSQGKIWIATNGTGLICLDKTNETFENFNNMLPEADLPICYHLAACLNSPTSENPTTAKPFSMTCRST